MDKVVLFGNGAIAEAAYYAFTYDSPFEVVGFTTGRDNLHEEQRFGLPVLPFDEIQSVFPPAQYALHIAVGYVGVNRVRAELYYLAKSMGYRMVNYVSSKALVGPDVVLGEHCSIGANSLVSPAVTIGDNVTIGANCFIGHDTIIKDHCFLADCVAIAGSVTIEPYCFFGINSTVRNIVQVAKECVIGAGALILQDTQERQVYIGKAAELLPVNSNNLNLK